MEERRHLSRHGEIPVAIHQCIVTILGKETWLAATASDFSAAGVSLLLDDSLNSGEKIYLLALVSPPGKPPRELSVNGVTSQCRPTDGKKWRVGVHFLDIEEFDQADWARYLDE